jgi:NTE family protein
LKPKELACYGRLFQDFGWYSSSYIYNWMQRTIANYCDGNGMATFADFKAHGFRDLYIVAANLTKRRAETFSYETTPDVAVADAVRMSMSIPFFFEALYFDGKKFGQGDLYVDGGMYDNYPVHMFDDPNMPSSGVTSTMASIGKRSAVTCSPNQNPMMNRTIRPTSGNFCS